MTTQVRHPIFARMYARLSVAADASGAQDHRERLLRGLRGEVVEIGAGNGLNFRHYPDEVTRVVAVEPEPHLRTRAAAAAREAGAPVEIVDGTADAIPLPGGSMDAAVASLVLCSVADQAVALAEIRRVLRPGGELRFYEHVAAADGRWSKRQRRIDPLWTRIAGGCHLTRDTEAAIGAAGFRIEACDRFLFQPCCLARAAAPHILGVARRP